MTCPHRHTDGAYVLGALSPPEREDFELHLASCEECTAAVRQLTPLPGLLGRVDPGALEQPAPDAARVPQLLATVAASRRGRMRRRRWRLALAVAAAVLVAAGGTAVATGAVGDLGLLEQPETVTMPPVGDTEVVTAEVRLEDAATGTEVWMRCRYPGGAGYGNETNTFRLVAIGEGGVREQLGSWRARPGQAVEMVGVTHLLIDDLVRIELQDEQGAPLLAHRL